MIKVKYQKNIPTAPLSVSNRVIASSKTPLTDLRVNSISGVSIFGKIS